MVVYVMFFVSTCATFAVDHPFNLKHAWSLPPASAVKIIELELCVSESVSTVTAKPFDL